MDKKRKCFACKHLDLCYKFKAVKEGTAWGFNIDTDDAPGKWADIFVALANACLSFTPTENHKQ